MKTRKLFGGAVSAAFILGLSATALADHQCFDEADEIIKVTKLKLLCAKFHTGSLWTYDPIWQFQGKKGEGCEVHDKLAKQLYVEHEDGEPPRDRGSKKNQGYREAQGAANALLDHKFEDAILHLRNFRETIESNAKLNPDPAPYFPEKSPGVDYTAAELAGLWMLWAEKMERKIFDPATNEGCSVP